MLRTDDGQGGIKEEKELTWGLGYGIGSAITLGTHVLLNIEALTIHVNEREGWTKELNQLNQLKILIDLRIGRRTSIFAGPSGNLMVSKLYDIESEFFGSKIMPYGLYDETINGTNVKMWIGFNARHQILIFLKF